MQCFSARSAAVAAALFLLGGIPAHSQQASITRGKYLVTLGGCNDCHTPGYFFGKPDAARTLGGSDVGFALPGLGTFVGANLTPDKETGLGNWSREDIVTAIQTGVTPDGRMLLRLPTIFAVSRPSHTRSLVPSDRRRSPRFSSCSSWLRQRDSRRSRNKWPAPCQGTGNE
jgi:hypothetical protein